LHRILIVDMENLICDTCRSVLGHLGHEIVCADEIQAIEQAKELEYDLVIVNESSNEMTGVDFLAKIRQIKPTLAGILITDQANSEVVIDAMVKGFSRVCKKPHVEEQLVEAVNETLKIADLREDVTRLKILLPLYQLGQRFIAAESEKAIYEELADAVIQEMNVSSVSVMMFDTVANALKIVASRGLDPDYGEDLLVKPGEQIVGKVFLSQRPVVLNKVKQHLNPYSDLMNRKELSAAISLPIISQEKVIGVLNISDTKAGIQFREPDIEMLSIIVGQATMALENIRNIREREENSRIRGMLEQYVSPEVSNLLVKSDHELLDVGLVQQLTVLFADIRKFTLLVQYLEPTQLREFLNSFFDMFGNIVFSYQGMLDKFMGDAALVIFGAPVKLNNPNVEAVSAAIRIMDEFETLRRRWEQENKIFAKVGLGIGISRGPMFLGNVGSSRRLDYTVIGPDVNIAQRLASETDLGKILVTDRVQATLDGKFQVKDEKRMLLRGMEAEVTVYSLSIKDFQ